jgi:hypothetical protein
MAAATQAVRQDAACLGCTCSGWGCTRSWWCCGVSTRGTEPCSLSLLRGLSCAKQRTVAKDSVKPNNPTHQLRIRGAAESRRTAAGCSQVRQAASAIGYRPGRATIPVRSQRAEGSAGNQSEKGPISLVFGLTRWMAAGRWARRSPGLWMTRAPLCSATSHTSRIVQVPCHTCEV